MNSHFVGKIMWWVRSPIVFVSLLALTINCLGAPGNLPDTSTEWRNDEANKMAVKELNKAYALIPFSSEYEGMLDQPPFEVSWTTGPNLPVTWKGGVAGILGEEVVLIGGLWMPGYRNLAFAFNL